ncbi:MAG: glutamine synthetase [Alphaproteobacteria bacterium]|nr:glutamine synthetase [Alphaproteobacteria bacterium]
MQPIRIRSAKAAAELVEKRGLDHVKVGVFDLDGVLRGKFMGRDKFLGALAKGFGFCDVVLGWDTDDQLYDNVSLTGWHTGYPDAQVRIVPETARSLPFEFDGKGLLFLAQFTGEAATVCPRNVAARIVERAAVMGFEALAAFEYEFFLFDETPHSVREKNYHGLRPMTPGSFGYSVLRTSVWSEFHGELLATAEAMDMGLEGLHTETGPGVMEASIDKDTGLAAADKAALFKTFSKVVAQRHGLMATYMAKWSPDYPGQSGHIHMSLKSKRGGHPVFHDAKAEHGMSPAMRHFVGGQQRLMPELLAMIAPTVNSYTRLVPGFWAPTTASWGIDNRTCALRVVPGGPDALRVEYRIAAADANPYLALAASLGAGLWGIEHEVEPTAPVVGNAYEAKLPAKLDLPRSLGEAAARLRRSKAAAEIFGDTFVQHYAASREWEEREFRKAITDWELKRYFEII